MRLAVGIDTGGTFTDLLACDLDEPEAPPISLKIPSSPTNPADAIAAAIEAIAPDPAARANIAFLAHGTTVATNAILQRVFPRTALITTEGFRDVVELARQRRPDLYDLSIQKPVPIAPRDLRFEIAERLAANGSVLTPIDEGSLRVAARSLAERQVDAIAVCFLHSYVDPRHELRAVALLQELLPSTAICASYFVMPEWREYERFSTTLVNAALIPVVGRYVRSLGEKLTSLHVRAAPRIIQSNGGLTYADQVERLPVTTLYSGPSAGVIGAVELGARIGQADLITLDIGGTSTDVCLVEDGQPAYLHEREVAGHPVKAPSLAVHSVGAGGGSIITVDPGGFIQVGPESAGASPGPACYGLGGLRPTISDAYVVLGWLGPEQLLGGRVRLHPSPAQQALEGIAELTGLQAVEAAATAVAMMTGNISRAIKLISLDRGHDPRRFPLVAFGGAGPMQAATVAEDLDIQRVIVPPWPGVLCAMGLLYAPTRADFARTHLFDFDKGDKGGLLAAFRDLEDRAREWALSAGDAAEAEILWSADMSLVGQDHYLTIELPERTINEGSLTSLGHRFRAEYRRQYGSLPPNAHDRVVTARVTIQVGASPLSRWLVPPAGSLAPGPIGYRDAYFPQQRATIRTPRYRRQDLRPTSELTGPAIIEQFDCTTVLPVGWRMQVDNFSNLILERS